MSAVERGIIFLSHSSNDKSFVKKIKERLDPANLFYDIDTMSPGQKTIEAMEYGVRSASVFVLFHSPSALSEWVGFEKDLARVAKIKSKAMKILVCPIEGESYRTLPEWMREYFTTTEDFLPKDVVRMINYLYAQALMEDGLARPPLCEGREELIRRVVVEVSGAPATLGEPVNVVLLTGIQGLGRSTLSRQILQKAFKGMRPAGPSFDLTDAADSVDWHLKFFEDLNGGLSPYEMARQIDAFPNDDPDAQADILLQSLLHWGALNQVVTIRSRWGLREADGQLKPWASALFKRLSKEYSVKIIIISDRRLPGERLLEFKNVRQYDLDPLTDDTISYILTETIDARYLNPGKISSISPKIHGHPATANHVSLLVNSGITLDSLDEFPRPIQSFQDKTLEEIYRKSALTKIQVHILQLLSWFPRLPAKVIKEVFSDTTAEDLFKQLWQLNEYSLITQTDGGAYSVLAIVSSTFRRFSDVSIKPLVAKITEILKDRFDKGELDVGLIDSMLIGTVSMDGDIAEEMKKIITPAMLFAVVDREYTLAKSGAESDARKHFELTYKLSKLALNLSCPDDTLESILFDGADSLSRIGRDPNEFLEVMFKKGFPSAHYVLGSYLYHQGRKFDEAAKQVELALKSGHFLRRGVRLLARIYLRAGKPEEALKALDRMQEASLLRDTGLVVMKARALKALRRGEEAEELLGKLGDVEDSYGERAVLLCGQALRAGDFPGAEKHLADARSAPRSNKVTLKFLECALAIEQGNNTLLPDACSIANANGREADALQLQARAAVFGGDWRSAEQYLNKIHVKDYFDLSIEARMLDVKLKSAEVLRDPALKRDCEARREEISRKSLGAVEGARFSV